jgi:hypothetical protein
VPSPGRGVTASATQPALLMARVMESVTTPYKLVQSEASLPRPYRSSNAKRRLVDCITAAKMLAEP